MLKTKKKAAPLESQLTDGSLTDDSIRRHSGGSPSRHPCIYSTMHTMSAEDVFKKH